MVQKMCVLVSACSLEADMVVGSGPLRREDKEGRSHDFNWLNPGSVSAGRDWAEKMGVASKGPVACEQHKHGYLTDAGNYM